MLVGYLNNYEYVNKETFEMNSTSINMVVVMFSMIWAAGEGEERII